MQTPSNLFQKDTLTPKLQKMINECKEKYDADVGIMGQEASRKDGTLTNAQIGRMHEEGSIANGITPRSWLRMPILRKKNEIIKAGILAIKKNLVNGVLNLKKATANMAGTALNASTEAFLTRGFGSWKPLSKATIEAKKGNEEPLIDTRQLIRSRTFRINKK